MIGWVVVTVLLLIIGIVTFRFNKALGQRMAKNWLEIFWWTVPASLRKEEYFILIYRVFWYMCSVFAFALAALGTSAIVSVLLGLGHFG